MKILTNVFSIQIKRAFFEKNRVFWKLTDTLSYVVDFAGISVPKSIGVLISDI